MRITCVVVATLVGACTSSSSGVDPNAACAGKEVPDLACVGGKREARCNTLPNGEARWQIDCLRGVKETDSAGTGISPCQPSECGPEPTGAEPGCMYGVTAGDCSSIDRGACAWRRRCLPKPCEPGAPGCNTLVESELGPPCPVGAGAGPTSQCAEGSCVTITPNAGEPTIGPVCVKDPCKALICAEGTSCAILTSYPGQLVCGH